MTVARLLVARDESIDLAAVSRLTPEQAVFLAKSPEQVSAEKVQGQMTPADRELYDQLTGGTR